MNAPQLNAGAFDHMGSRGARLRRGLGLIAPALSACALLLAPVTARAAPAGSADAVTPPTISESFPSAWVAHGGTIAMNFMLSNPNAATNFVTTGFSDTLPSGLALANPETASGTCISADGGTVTAPAGGQQFQLSAVNLAASTSCTLTIDVVGTVSGHQPNTTGAPVASFVDQASQVQTITGSPAFASVLVLFAPILHVEFNSPSIPVNGVATLRFRIRNPGLNPVALTGVTFADQLPPNLTVANPSFPQNTCGGTWQAVPGSSQVQLSGGTIAPGSQCSLTVDVLATAEGLVTDVAGPVSSTIGGVGNSAEASVVVVRPPTISVQMQRWVYSGGTARVRFTITNPNSATSLNILVFYVHMSPKLTVAANPNVGTNCAGGSLTATPGQTTMRFLNGVVPAGSSCQISVTLRADGLGVKRVETTRLAAVGAVPGNRAIAALKVITCHRH